MISASYATFTNKSFNSSIPETNKFKTLTLHYKKSSGEPDYDAHFVIISHKKENAEGNTLFFKEVGPDCIKNDPTILKTNKLAFIMSRSNERTLVWDSKMSDQFTKTYFFGFEKQEKEYLYSIRSSMNETDGLKIASTEDTIIISAFLNAHNFVNKKQACAIL